MTRSGSLARDWKRVGNARAPMTSSHTEERTVPRVGPAPNKNTVQDALFWNLKNTVQDGVPNKPQLETHAGSRR